MTKKRVIPFRLEARLRRADGILPVFLPFAGCPYRCMYCAQDRQTGAGRESVAGALERLRCDARAWLRRGRVPEVAFYGGTFTALPESDFAACLDALADVRAMFSGLEREKGVRVAARCSTRPDCCGAERLERLKEAGVSLVELGVQSFDSAALQAVRRGYDGETVLEACDAVRGMGLLPGVQLMPGMPGSDAGVFARDVAAAIAQKPA
ncbi:MAG: radical SAM protein, partial [Mailhella sp.]|nr:radical SAM protein [Mailhella sp.]